MARRLTHTADLPAPEELSREILARLSRLEDRTARGLRQLRRECSRRVRAAPARYVIALGEHLVGSGQEFSRFLACEMIACHPGGIEALGPRSVRRLGQGLDSWEAVDTFCCQVAGRAWREGRLTDDHILAWARSTDRWWRRAALVATVPLNCRAQGGRGDPKRTLRICRRLVQDRDDMVVKALSWALRELIFWDAAAVAAFLEKHRDALAPRVIREVTCKLTTGHKSPPRGRRS